MHTLIFGAGAVGGYLGAKLLQAGWPVTFLGRQSTASALNARGLRLVEGNSSHELTDIQAVHQWPPVLESPPELILLTVKAYDCRQAADQIAQSDWRIPVVSFINGVGSQALLQERLGPGFSVIAATLTTAVEKPAANLIQVAKLRGVGLEQSGEISEELAVAFLQSGITTRQYQDAASMKWSKLLSNLIGSATAALTGFTVGQIYNHPGLFRLEVAALREAISVMQAMGCEVQNLPGAPMRWLALGTQLPGPLLQPLLRRAVATSRGGKRPSMYYDVARGRTEVDWLHGAVVKSGRQAGVPTPANNVLTEQVHQLQRGQRLVVERLLERASAAGVDALAGYNRSGN